MTNKNPVSASRGVSSPLGCILYQRHVDVVSEQWLSDIDPQVVKA